MTGQGLMGGIALQLRRAGWRLFEQELERVTLMYGAAQWYPRSVIEQSQWQAVSDLVMSVRDTSAFYRTRLEHLPPGRLDPEVFRALPTLTRRDIICQGDEIRTRAATGSALFRRQSGGSRGASVSVPVDVSTYCHYVAGTHRGLQWWGTDFSERGVLLLGPGSRGLRALATRAKDWVMNWLRVRIDDGFDRRAPDILDRITAFQPAFLYGYPSAIHQLARAAMDGGRTLRHDLKVIVLTGEPVYRFQRSDIARVFGCPVAEEYGSGELGSMAFECPQHRLHVTAENVYLESAAYPGADTSVGLILATQLHNRLFPLIRYETGDLGTVESGSCQCGRALPTLRVAGRVLDRLQGAAGTRPARACIDELYERLPDRLRGRVQVAHGRPSSVVLQVARAGAEHGDVASVAAVGRAVFGSDWHVGVREVRRFARLPSGKLPYFFRLRLPP